jgi:hypothetical protein
MNATAEHDETRARRGADRCVPPLRLLAIALVLPMVHTYFGSVSPLAFGFLQVSAAIETWPLFLLAGGLAMLTWLQPAGGPRPAAARAVMLPPVLLWLKNGWPAVKSALHWVESPPATRHEMVEALALLVALPLSIFAYTRALRSPGWARWRYALASFAAATWLTFPAQYLISSFLGAPTIASLLPGAYVFAVALIWLSIAAAVYRHRQRA